MRERNLKGEQDCSEVVSTSHCGDPIMAPQERVLDAVLRAQGVLADYVESGPRDCAQTLSRLFVIFADDGLTDAANILNLESMSRAMTSADQPKRSPTSPLYNRTSG